MKKKILGRNVEPRCGYCQRGTRSPDGKTVLCPKKGVLDKDDFCKKFRYDPLKRIPRGTPEILSFSERDFSLSDGDADLPARDAAAGAPREDGGKKDILSDGEFILE